MENIKEKAKSLQNSTERTELLLQLFKSGYPVTTLSKIFNTKVIHVADTLRSFNLLPQLTTLICTNCGQTKSINDFPIASNKITGRQGKCSVCWSDSLSTNYHKDIDNRKLQSLNRQRSPTGKQYRKIYDSENREHINEYHSKYYQSEKQQQYHREYRIKNAEKRLEYNKQWFKTKYDSDVQFRINNTFGTRMYHSIKDLKASRSWEDLVDYTLEELLIHLESKFQPGMKWENYGQWHIDHIKPVSLFIFDALDSNEFKECWSLENLQPLWAEDNLKKSNKYKL